jgi:hypothetical protein
MLHPGYECEFGARDQGTANDVEIKHKPRRQNTWPRLITLFTFCGERFVARQGFGSSTSSGTQSLRPTAQVSHPPDAADDHVVKHREIIIPSVSCPGHADIAPSRHYGGHGAMSVVRVGWRVRLVARKVDRILFGGVEVDVVEAACWLFGGYRRFI